MSHDRWPLTVCIKCSFVTFIPLYDERTKEITDGRTDRKHNAFTDAVGNEGVKHSSLFIMLTTAKKSLKLKI